MINLDSWDITLSKKQRHYFANKGPYSQTYCFSSSHVWMWELDHKKGWVPKNWFLWTMVLNKTLENPLNSREIKTVNPKGNQSWIFIGKTDAEAETPILWPPDVKSWHWKRLWGWERLRTGGEDNRGQDSWIASLTQWTWVWVNSGRLGRTGKPGMLQPTGIAESDPIVPLNNSNNNKLSPSNNLMLAIYDLVRVWK